MTKTIFITGASSGIGKATAKAVAERGWNVGLFARSTEKLESIAREIGEQALVLTGDATQQDAQAAALAKLKEHFGSVDAAFANAGRGSAAAGIEDGDPEDWEGMIDLNVKGALYTAHASLPYLREVKGQFLVTGSMAGSNHIKGSVYGATKWFIHGLAGNLAKEMAEWGGRCVVISPGMVDTSFFDTAKPDKLKPQDIADAVVFALSAAPRANIREISISPMH